MSAIVTIMAIVQGALSMKKSNTQITVYIPRSNSKGRLPNHRIATIALHVRIGHSTELPQLRSL